jgi:hypothetical protein
MSIKEMKRLDLNRVHAVLQLMNEFCDNLTELNDKTNKRVLARLSKYKLLNPVTIKMLEFMFEEPNSPICFEPLIIDHSATCACGNNEYHCLPYTLVIEELEDAIADYFNSDLKIRCVKFNLGLMDSDCCGEHRTSKEPSFKSIDWHSLL